LVKLMGTSAWYAPGAAAAQMVEAILRDENRIFPCCIKLEGQYGMNNVYLGVPVKLGKGGIREVIELNLNEAEMQLLRDSAGHVKVVMDAYDNIVAQASN
jgi:malate dehydrogenase